MPKSETVQVESLRFASRDGRLLAATSYLPVESNGRSVLINSAMAVKRSYYDAYARYLAGRGFKVLTYDYRGISDSSDRPIAEEDARLRQWGEADTAAAIDWLHAERPDHRLLVVAHSAGGQVFGLADSNQRVAGLMMISSQSGYWRHWPPPRRWLLAVLWYAVIPGLTRAYGRFPGRLGLGSADLPAGIAREWARWARHPDYLVDARGTPLREHFHTYRGAILACRISDDWMAPQAAVDALLRFYPQAKIERRRLTPQDAGRSALGHFGYFRDPGRPLWPAGAEWLLAA